MVTNDHTLTHDEYRDTYTIEVYGDKGWEVIKVIKRQDGILKATQDMLHMVVNDRQLRQWRLTTPEYQL